MAHASFGQFTSINGWFRADNIAGCEGLVVNIDTTGLAPLPCFYTANCTVNWGDGTQSNSTSHTYTTGGSYYLVVDFQNDDGSDSLQININESLPPEFNLYACTGRSVAVEVTDMGYDNYIIQANNGDPEDTIAQGALNQIYNYSTLANQTIGIRGLDNDAFDNCSSNSKTITTLDALPSGAINSLEVISETTLVLTYSLADDILYQLQIAANGNNTFAPYKKLTSAIVSDTISGLDLANNYYCFQIATKNACDNSTDNTSEKVCSIIPSLAINDNVNTLSWQTQNPGQGFDILRDDLTNPLISVNSTVRTFDDTDITCNTDYCYTLIGKYGGGVTSTSLAVCGTSFSTTPPDAISNISTQVTQDAISLIWEAPASDTNLTYKVYLKNNGGRTLLTATDTTFFMTNELETNVQQCFEILVSDECGNETTQSITGCTILVSGGINNTNELNINWTAFTGWQNGVANYTVQKSYDLNSFTSTNTTETSFSQTDNSNNQVIYYVITANPIGSLTKSISNTLKIIKPNNIYFPNAFTPDGNNRNETFEVHGRFITEFQLYIFDRWGNILFATNDMTEGWDGTMNGKELPQGTYAFKAKMVDQAGREIEKTGTIVLLRK